MYEQFYLHCNVLSDAGRSVTLCKLFYVTSDAWLSVTLYCSNGFTLRNVIVALQVTLDATLTHKCINGFTLRYVIVAFQVTLDVMLPHSVVTILRYVIVAFLVTLNTICVKECGAGKIPDENKVCKRCEGPCPKSKCSHPPARKVSVHISLPEK